MLDRFFNGLVRAVVLCAATLGACGCQLLGPEVVAVGRPRYNEVINRTSSLQLLTNLVRVYQNESPFSLEVSSIIAGGSAGGSIAGTASALGGVALGSVTPMLSYTEQPSITYQPVSGEALVQEFANPVPVTLL